MNDRYHLIRCIESSENTCVDIVEDQLTSKVFLRKSISKQADAMVIHQFHMEINVLSMVHHAYIPEIVDVYEDRDRKYLIESYIQGTLLNEYLASHKALGKLYRFRFLMESMEIMDYIHQKGFLYIDWKPENMIVSNRHIHVIDFNSCIESGSTQIVSVSRFNYSKDFLEVKTRKPETDILAWSKLIRYLYPKDAGMGWIYHRCRKKVYKDVHQVINSIKRIVFGKIMGIAFILYIMSAFLLKSIMPVNDPFHTYLNTRKPADFIIAFKSSKKQKDMNDYEALYYWIQHGWITSEVISEQRNADYLAHVVLDAKDAQIAGYIWKHTDRSTKERNPSLWFSILVMSKEKPDFSFLNEYLAYLKKHSMTVCSLNEYLLINEIVISPALNNSLKEQMIQDVDKISEKDACTYLEYMLFEKSKNVYVQIPDCYQKKWKESPQWNQLFNIWRDIK